MSFKATVDRFIQETSESSMAALVNYCRSDSVSDLDVAYLAEACAESSGCIWRNLTQAADVASTGGPSSLTTLLCPLYLRALGYKVPKLGVPGRPAGGIDVLAQIPGFKFLLTDGEATEALSKAGYVHFLAGKTHGKYDALLFNYRKRIGALNVTPLVIASLLTKKIIVGLSCVGLDVRVSPFGNFGVTWDEARQNAMQFCRVANLLRINGTCVLTDASVPYQPYIGRGEALVALSRVLSDSAPDELQQHTDVCYAIASATTRSYGSRPSWKHLLEHFKSNLQSQGTSFDRFMEKVTTVINEHKLEITAQEDGFCRVDLEKVRAAFVTYRSSDKGQTPEGFSDSLGLILRCANGAFLRKGDLIATVRADPHLWRQVVSHLEDALRPVPLPIKSRYFEEVRYV
jgi:thymidine phosphorylase